MGITLTRINRYETYLLIASKSSNFERSFSLALIDALELGKLAVFHQTTQIRFQSS